MLWTSLNSLMLFLCTSNCLGSVLHKQFVYCFKLHSSNTLKPLCIFQTTELFTVFWNAWKMNSTESSQTGNTELLRNVSKLSRTFFFKFITQKVSRFSFLKFKCPCIHLCIRILNCDAITAKLHFNASAMNDLTKFHLYLCIPYACFTISCSQFASFEGPR